ncbi:MAG: hypothetical protein AAGH83_10025, partial [Pseudomonadota bacterium]
SQYLLSELKKRGLVSREIANSEHALQIYRKKVIDARNKLIAHADLESYREEIVYGQQDEGDAPQFFCDLQSFTDLVGMALNVGALDYSHQPGRGDVYDLLQVLRAYRRLSDSKDA